jgi:hypothetical protein
MANPPNPRVSPRVDPEMIERIDRVALAMNAVKRRGAPILDRGDVVRLLLLEALKRTERRYGLSPLDASPQDGKNGKESAPKRKRA